MEVVWRFEQRTFYIGSWRAKLILAPLVIQRLQIRVVKRTAMGKQLRFFFTMLSTSDLAIKRCSQQDKVIGPTKCIDREHEGSFAYLKDGGRRKD